MVYDGMRLIDDEIFALHKKGATVSDEIYEDLSPRGMSTRTPRDLWDTYDGFGSLFKRVTDQVPLSVLEQYNMLRFISEDMKNNGLCRQSIFRQDFPAMFYFPTGELSWEDMDGESDYDNDHNVDNFDIRRISALSCGAIQKASRHVAMVRAAFLMKGFETAEALIMHGGMQYKEYQANAKIKFHECIESTAYGLAQDGIIDAFRIVARDAVLKFPGDELRYCFWYTIKMADNCCNSNGNEINREIHGERPLQHR